MMISNVAKLLMLLFSFFQLSDQRRLFSNQPLQGRQRRSSSYFNDVTARPLSEEEFDLALYHSEAVQKIEESNRINGGLEIYELFLKDDINDYDYEDDYSGGDDKAHNAVNNEDRLWKDGIIPYTISDAFSNEERIIIARAIRNIQDKSCIEFVPRTTQVDYIHIIDGIGCISDIGRMKGKQDLSLRKSGCIIVETIIHELMHALGFSHEHNRPDRDQHIYINVDNLEDGAYSKQFKIYNTNQYQTFTNYDINSIMHYHAFHFAKNKTIPTIISRLTKHGAVGSIDGLLSPIDIFKLNKLYNCESILTKNCPVEYLEMKNNRCVKIPNFGCYCIVKEKKTHEEAEQFCRNHKMQLVWFQTKEEGEKVNELLFENDLAGFWTSGANRDLDGEWQWEQSTPSNSFPVSYANWCAKSPDNYDEDEFYILAKNQVGGSVCWDDASGDARWPAICKYPLNDE